MDFGKSSPMAIGQTEREAWKEKGTENKGKLKEFLSVAWSSTFS